MVRWVLGAFLITRVLHAELDELKSTAEFLNEFKSLPEVAGNRDIERSLHTLADVALRPAIRYYGKDPAEVYRAALETASRRSHHDERQREGRIHSTARALFLNKVMDRMEQLDPAPSFESVFKVVTEAANSASYNDGANYSDFKARATRWAMRRCIDGKVKSPSDFRLTLSHMLASPHSPDIYNTDNMGKMLIEFMKLPVDTRGPFINHLLNDIAQTRGYKVWQEYPAPKVQMLTSRDAIREMIRLARSESSEVLHQNILELGASNPIAAEYLRSSGLANRKPSCPAETIANLPAGTTRAK